MTSVCVCVCAHKYCVENFEDISGKNTIFLEPPLLPEWLVPEAADVDPGHLGGPQHLTQRPHQGTVHLRKTVHVRYKQFDVNST